MAGGGEIVAGRAQHEREAVWVPHRQIWGASVGTTPRLQSIPQYTPGYNWSTFPGFQTLWDRGRFPTVDHKKSFLFPSSPLGVQKI